MISDISQKVKVALVYDRVNKWGGAERVLLALHKMFPEAPLYTAVYDPIKAPWAKVFPKIISSRLRGRHELLGWLMPLAFESFNFNEYDLVISVTSEAAKGIITKPGTKHICYCLSPTRYLWSGYEDYFSNPILKLFTQPVVKYLRHWDKIAGQRPDMFIAISQEVQNRIKKYYNRDSLVIYPPVEVNKFKNHLRDKYFLVVSRLVKYKKIDLAIRAFNKLGYPLIIVGQGNEEKKLKRMANKNIKFIGQVTEDKLVEIYQSARTLIFPQKEDFGIVAVEAQAAGIPVLAFNGGGAKETVVDGKTGVFFTKQTVNNLVRGIKKINMLRFKEQDLRDNAKKFSESVFRREFMDIINND